MAKIETLIIWPEGCISLLKEDINMKYISLFALFISTNLFACYSDYQCGFGRVCVKPENSFSMDGICVTPVDEFGNKDYGARMEQEIGPREIEGCSWNTDCDIGFKCLKEAGQLEGVCVK